MFTTFNTPRSSKSSMFNSTQSPINTQIIERQKIKKTRESILWGTINLALFSILLYDLINTCELRLPYFHYFEYLLTAIFGLNSMYHCFKYVKTYACGKRAEAIEVIQINKYKDMKESLSTSYQNVVNNSYTNSTMNLSTSCLTNTSFNTSLSPQSWSFQQGTPQTNQSPVYKSSPILNSMEVNNEMTLNKYLRDYQTLETTQNRSTQEKSTNLLSFFWNHPAMKINKEASPLLRVHYQLSTPTSPNSSPKTDDKGSPLNKSSAGLDTWRRLNVDSVALTQWNENLRMWLSQTILSRLVVEFASIDKSLIAHGLSDVKIGGVGLDRLRKTAQGPILQSIPNLPMIVPFLELHSNQEYLVQRITELSKGGCMSEYKWNGGSFYNGKEWDVSLPTDAAIIMHLTATYLDTQLLPLPNRPDVKPFTGYHFIKSNEKLPELTPHTHAIHEVSVNPPHYRVIIGMETYEMVKGYNNLFHSILLFLYHVNQKEHGMLGRVNLGRSGVNILWIIQSN